MFENAKRFQPQEITDVSKDISDLRNAAFNNEDFEVTERFNESVADFKLVLLENFDESELIQVPAFHALIGSGISEGTVFKNEITSHKKEEIESKIRQFVEGALKNVSN